MTTSPLVIAANLAIDEEVARRRAAGEDIVHLAFGEAGLPVFPGLVGRLVEGAAANAYGPVAGGEAARAAVAGYFDRRRLPTAADQIVLAPGSKPLLAAVTAAVAGDVILPAPSWVTYAPQARLFGRRVHSVPISERWGGVPDPDRLQVLLGSPRGGAPRLVVLTLPDNPTGTLAPPAVVRDLCALAEEHDLVVLSDEIYRDVVFDSGRPYLSPAEVVPERTVVTTGLSKSLALGGWRIGAARFPATPWGADIRRRVVGAASNVWSNLAGPMQAVAELAFGEPPDLVEFRTRATRLHGIVARRLHQVLTGHGVACRPPDGGFYLYPDFEVHRRLLAAAGMVDAPSLERRLLADHGIAAMAGHHFGDDPAALRLRLATSLLYGATEPERWAALHADDPLALAHVAEPLRRVDEVLAKLVG